MGQYPSTFTDATESKRIEEGTPHTFEYNADLKLSAWDTYLPKNKKYYSGDRFFKVSRKHYPQYERGYIYGYYEDVNYYKVLEELQYPLEIAF